jgi:hypothetical protein
MDQSSVKPYISVLVNIEENMIRQITLCQEHIMTIELQIHTKEY